MVMRLNVFVKPVEPLKAGLCTASIATEAVQPTEGSAQIAAQTDDNYIS